MKKKRRKRRRKVLSSPPERSLFYMHVQSSRSTLKRPPPPFTSSSSLYLSEAFLSAILSSSGSNRSQERKREREETTRWKAESRSLAPVGFWTVSVGHFSARYFCSLARGRGSRHVTRLPALRTRHRFPTDFLATVQARLTRKLGIDTRGCPREHLPRERSNLSGEL